MDYTMLPLSIVAGIVTLLLLIVGDCSGGKY